MAKRYKGEFRFFAEDFWNMLKGQQYRCALTNRELTPMNTEVELREPAKVENRASLDNHYLVDKAVSYLARNLSEEEIITLAVEIVTHKGKEYGYAIRKQKKS